MKHFTSSSSYFKSVFDKKVYKISLSSGATCPNRDGKKGYGGCIFCSNTGSGEFTFHENPIEEQIEKAKLIVDKKLSKNSNKKYIAYFQNFSNTYLSVEKLKALFSKTLEDEDIIALDIATRPDCLSDEILSLLKELSTKTRLIIELGLQTSNENTVAFINRCYMNEEYETAVKKLHEIKDIHIITHIILGLPNESEEDMLKSVKYAVKNGTDGIKLTCLYILKNTPISSLYHKGELKVLEMDEYFSLLFKALMIIPETIIIHRLTGDGDKKSLVAPKWTENKKFVLNSLKKYLFDNGIEIT